MSAAFRLRAVEMGEEATRLTALRNDLWDRLLSDIPGVSVNGPRALRLPGNLNASFERVEADSLIVAMRHFSLSSGSACSSGERGPSPVLLAIGVGEEAALGSLRFGLGKSNTADEMTMLLSDLKRSVARLREISAA
jgi:cysteine desulfurase